MKHRPKGIRRKLWLYFALFAVVILALLWLMQTVLMRSGYSAMVESDVSRAARAIVEHRGDEGFEDMLDGIAREHSLLIVLTDDQGNLIYSTDEHSSAYANDTADENLMGWQRGKRHYLALPADFQAFLEKIENSQEGRTAYTTDDETTYVYGLAMEDHILYISATLTAVGATVNIIRIQLIIVSLAALLLSLLLAWHIARRFSRPIAVLSEQAAGLAEGQFDGGSSRGFCEEVDVLADSMARAAADITEARSYQRDFLANISHDLRTPLTMIRGYAEMVRDISWRDEAQREADLSVIIDESDRLTGLVNDIIDFSKLDSGRMEVKCRTMDLSGMAREVVGQFEALCLREGYRIVPEIEPGLCVVADEEQLSRVLYNLIGNAIDHTGEGRTVWVNVSRQGSAVRTEVRDDGPGISPEDLHHIWNRYFKSMQAGRGPVGSGLGLAICQEILEAHGCRYGVDSEVGQGSLFWFEMDASKG